MARSDRLHRLGLLSEPPQPPVPFCCFCLSISSIFTELMKYCGARKTEKKGSLINHPGGKKEVAISGSAWQAVGEEMEGKTKETNALFSR